MKSFLGISFILIITFLSSFFIEPDPLIPKIKHQLYKFYTTIPQEKIYLHLDKSYYASGETIWFKAHLLSALSNAPTTSSRVMYVELSNCQKEVLATHRLKVTEHGASGDFVLSDSLPSGQYLIRAYTSFMQNLGQQYFFHKEISIINAEETDFVASGTLTNEKELKNSTANSKKHKALNIQFFPEGGDLVENISTVIGIKAVNTEGKGVSIEGGVVDQDGNAASFFKTNHLGIGTLLLTALPGKKYFAQITINGETQKFPMPAAKPEGYGMYVENAKEDRIQVMVRSNTHPLQGGTLVGQMGGHLVFSIENESDEDGWRVLLSKEQLSSGVLRITFFDANQLPRCERLVFVRNPAKEVSLSIASDQPMYDRRSKAKFTVDLQATDYDTLFANLSVSITDTLKVPDLSQRNIYTYLLLSSEVKGKIENPKYYFQDDNWERQRALDQLMLTQGWRRFRWEALLHDSLPDFSHPLERGLTFSGQLTNFYKREEPVRGKVSLTLMGDVFYMDTLTTSEDGQFIFPGFDLQDSVQVIVQGEKIKRNGKTNKDVFIALHQNSPPPLQYKFSSKLNPIDELHDFLEQRNRIRLVEQAYDFDSVIVLENIVVKASRPFDPFESANMYGIPSHRLIMDSIPGVQSVLTVFDMVRRLPGVQVYGAPLEQRVFIRGAEAFYLLDNVPADANMINAMHPSQIAYIDVLKGAAAAIFGSRGAGGVVAVYTRTGFYWNEPEREKKGIISFKYPGYYPEREFYIPAYDVKREEHVRPDYRTTLFWKPDLTTNQEGKTAFSFYTSDDVGTYRVAVEGITHDGIPVVGEYYFEVK